MGHDLGKLALPVHGERQIIQAPRFAEAVAGPHKTLPGLLRIRQNRPVLVAEPVIKAQAQRRVGLPAGAAEPAGPAGGFLESGQGLQDRLSRCPKAKSRFTRTVPGVGWAHTAARRCSPTGSCVRTSMVSTLSQHRSKDFFMPGQAPQGAREQ